MTKHHPILELFLTRMRTFYREPEAIFWTYVFPVLLTIGLGIAFRNKAPEVVDVDIERSPAAEAIKAALDELDAFDAHIHEGEVCANRLRLGKTAVVVRLCDEYGDPPRTATGSRPPSSGKCYAYRYDPSRPESLAARDKVDDALQRASGRVDVIKTVNDEVTEPGARYIDFLIPGLIGMNIMSGGLWGMGFMITDMRVRKLLKRLVAAPMKKWHFMFAQIAGRMVFTVPEMIILLGAGWLLFDMHIAGTLINMLLVAFIGSLTFAGIGLLTASRAQRIESISGLVNLVMLPMWLFSGMFFSYERFPDAFQPFIQLLPLTHLIDALRAIILEGASLMDQSFHMLVLAIWSVVTFVLALKFFRWT